MSLSPDESLILDVVNHKTLHVSAVGGSGGQPSSPSGSGGPGGGPPPLPVFEFDDPEVRIDYPVWSPDGTLVSFDRFVPRGGDVWVLEPRPQNTALSERRGVV